MNHAKELLYGLAVLTGTLSLAAVVLLLRRPGRRLTIPFAILLSVKALYCLLFLFTLLRSHLGVSKVVAYDVYFYSFFTYALVDPILTIIVICLIARETSMRGSSVTIWDSIVDWIVRAYSIILLICVPLSAWAIYSTGTRVLFALVSQLNLTCNIIAIFFTVLLLPFLVFFKGRQRDERLGIGLGLGLISICNLGVLALSSTHTWSMWITGSLSLGAECLGLIVCVLSLIQRNSAGSSFPGNTSVQSPAKEASDIVDDDARSRNLGRTPGVALSS